MPGSDQHDAAAGDSAVSRSGTVPGSEPGTTVQQLAVPSEWPEPVAYRTGRRLFDEGADEVPMLMRQGIPILHYLTPEEVGAKVGLPEDCWERWFRLGWSHAAGDREGWDC